jgi:hypothetical protein
VEGRCSPCDEALEVGGPYVSHVWVLEQAGAPLIHLEGCLPVLRLLQEEGGGAGGGSGNLVQVKMCVCVLSVFGGEMDLESTQNSVCWANKAKPNAM